MTAYFTSLDAVTRTLLITLQRQKTKMETAGLQEQYWPAYWNLSEAIWNLEKATGVSAPALRDEEDARDGRRFTT